MKLTSKQRKSESTTATTTALKLNAKKQSSGNRLSTGSAKQASAANNAAIPARKASEGGVREKSRQKASEKDSSKVKKVLIPAHSSNEEVASPDFGGHKSA